MPMKGGSVSLLHAVIRYNELKFWGTDFGDFVLGGVKIWYNTTTKTKDTKCKKMKWG